MVFRNSSFPFVRSTLLLLLLFVGTEGQDYLTPNQQALQNKPRMNMTLCHDKCRSGCTTYVTPISECYSSGKLFPNDPSWSGLDVFDTVICQTLTRRIFQSSDGLCSSSDSDKFLINLEECVGPFGKPRPWGKFSLVRDDNNDDGFLAYSC
jgi:hypothetical protein